MRSNSWKRREAGAEKPPAFWSRLSSLDAVQARRGQGQEARPDEQRSSLFAWFAAATFSPDWVARPLARPVIGYVLALGGQILAVLVIVALSQLFPTLRFCESLLLLMIFLLAWGWGIGPALVATGSGAVMLLAFWLSSSFSAHPGVQLEIFAHFVLYLVTGLALAILTSRAQQARYTAQTFGRRLQEIIDALPDPLIFYDTQGQAVHFNGAASARGQGELLDFSPAQISHQLNLRDAMGTLQAAHDLPLARALRGEPVTGMEVHYQPLRSGAERTIAVSATPLRAQADDLIIGAVITTHDLSSLREAEREATRRAQQLEAIFDAITDGVFSYDEHDNAPRLNRAAWDLLGIPLGTREGVLPGPPFYLTDEQGSVLAQEEWPEARVRRGERLQGDDAVDVLLCRHDGETRYVSVTGAPLYDAGGSINGGVLVCRDVTERHTLEQQLSAQASQLEAMLEAVPDALFLTNQEGETIRMNQAAHRLLSIEDQPADSWLGQHIGLHLKVYAGDGRVLSPEEWPSSRILRGEVLDAANAANLILHTRDGREVFISMTGGPVYDAEQRIVGAVTVARDMTESLGVERRVRISEHEAAEWGRQLEATFHAMIDGVVIYDARGHMLRINMAYNKLIALDKFPEHAQATPAERGAMLALRDEYGHPLLGPQQPVQRMLAGEVFTADRAMDIQVRALDGREVQLNVTGTPMYDQEQRLTGGVLIFRDVTARRALERRTQEALEALLTMAEELVHLPEQAQQENNSTSSIDNVSRPLAELIRRVLGCQRVSLTGVDQQTHELHSLAVVGITPEMEQLWRERRAGFSLQGIMSKVASIDLRPGGNPLVVDFTQPPLSDFPNPFNIHAMLLAPMTVGQRMVGVLALDHGETAHVYTQEERELTRAVADLSALVIERARLQREQAEAQASALALRETNHMMDEFIGIAGHELRTPLTTIKASVQLANRQTGRLLAQQNPLPAPLEKQLSIIKGHLERTERQIGMQNRLVSDLLDVSRIHADRLQLHPELCDLVTLVREVVGDQQYLTPQRRLELLLDIPKAAGAPEEVLVLADPDRIRQVISNYLSNALKYSEADKPVSICVDLLDTQVRVSVSDEGPGLTSEQQQRIWERFYRAPGIEVKSGSGVGLGLGLHISRTIIERQDGQVGVQSEPGHGSTFWFTLPLAEQKSV